MVVPKVKVMGFRSDYEESPISYIIGYAKGTGDIINLHEAARSYWDVMQVWTDNKQEAIVITASQDLQNSF